MDTIKTQDVAIPRLGFGTFRMPGGGCQPVLPALVRLAGFFAFAIASDHKSDHVASHRAPNPNSHDMHRCLGVAWR